MGILQHAFPNSTLKLDDVVHTTDEVDILQLLKCTELRDVTICPMPAPGGRGRPIWCAVAALGRLHGSRLQLHVPQSGAFRMLEAEPSLAAHVSQADLRCHPSYPSFADAGSSLVDQVSSLSSLTQLILPTHDSLLGKAGMLDALRQLSALQSLFCMGHDMQTLLVNSVPRSWSLLTQLELGNLTNEPDPLDWSLVEQQCPQLQALAMHSAVPLTYQGLTALTSLTCQVWYPQDRAWIQCSRLGNLYVDHRADPNLLPSTVTSLSLNDTAWQEPSPCVVDTVDDHLRSVQSLVHMCFKSHLWDLSQIQERVPASHPALSSVTSVEFTFHPQAFLADMDGQHFHHLGACFLHLQRVHIHLNCSYSKQPKDEVLISAAWLPAHCRLVVTHQLTCPVRVVECPSGCLSLPLHSRPADEWRAY